MYVEDLLTFYISIFKNLKNSNIINVGTGKDLKIKDYYYLIQKS